MVHPGPRPGAHILPHMSQNLPADKQGASLPPAPRTRRVSARVRHALTVRVKEGRSWLECAERANLSEAGIHKARKQPHVQKLYEEMKAQYVQDIEALEGVHKARALEVARELLDQTESKQVRARMVEFLRGERGKPAVSVTLNQQFNGGYEVAPRGAKLVEIVQSDDISEAQAEESTEEQ
jgi:predicted secreted protein